jgi:starch synthase
MLRMGFSATNPCHLYGLAQAVSKIEPEAAFYSGYPRWRLDPPYPTHLHCHSFRTVVTYSLLRLPERVRPRSRSLFLWQDRHFDAWVGDNLRHHDFIHAIPGQALMTFRCAKERGIRTVLNHATGPSRHWVRIMEGEYRRVGIPIERTTVYDDSYWVREAEEYQLADFHCVASSVVRDQLLECGVPKENIWVVSYGASPDIFFPPQNREWDSFRILFAGQVILRKGIVTLLQALSMIDFRNWTVDFFGSLSGEVQKDLAAYRGKVPLKFHGAVSQRALAGAMRRSSILVLASLEEGFGLVVPQALSCGTPCIVSDRVGAKDLISHHKNGSVFPVGDPYSLADELFFWADKHTLIQGDFSWQRPAHRLLAFSTKAMMPTRETP